jgi:hypothetical protein
MGRDIMTKLKNHKTEYLGIKFDSEVEKRYYIYLLGLQKEGYVTKIELQPKIILQPTFKRDGKTYRAITYKPDFYVEYHNGNKEYIDVKGMATQQGEMRRKMYLYRNEIPLRWISASKKYGTCGWIDYDELHEIRRQNKKWLKARENHES